MGSSVGSGSNNSAERRGGNKSVKFGAADYEGGTESLNGAVEAFGAETCTQ